MKQKDIVSNLKDLIKILDRQILETPTSDLRNVLANANIFLMSAVDELKKVIEYEKRGKSI